MGTVLITRRSSRLQNAASTWIHSLLGSGGGLFFRIGRHRDLDSHGSRNIAFIAEEAHGPRFAAVGDRRTDAAELTNSAARCARADPRGTVSSRTNYRCQSHYAVLADRQQDPE